MKKLTYHIIQSNLPSYLSVRDNGKVFLEGIIQLEDSRSPIWTTESGEILRIDEGSEDVSVSIHANPSNGASFIQYSVLPPRRRRQGVLPFGLKLNYQSGEIYGYVMRSLNRNQESKTFYDDEIPIWDESQETTFSFDERTEVDIGLLATPRPGQGSLNFEAIGFLPFGLKLDREQGRIYGNTDNLLTATNNEVEEVTPKPRWKGTFGLIGRYNEKEPVNIQLEATPRNGSEISYNIVNGYLPWSIKLSKDGLLYGTTSEVLFPETQFITDKFAPIIVNDSMLSGYKIGDNVSIVLNAEVSEGRTVDYYTLYPDKTSDSALPFGLVFDKSGTISGTISDFNEAGTFNFTVVVYDSASVKSCKVFTLVVDNIE